MPSGKNRRKFGIVMIVLGLLCALLLGSARDSAQANPNLGEDNDMGGALGTVDFLIGLGWVEVVVGAIMAIWPVKKDKTKAEDPGVLKRRI